MNNDDLVKHLYNVLYRLHTVYGSTTGPRGGIGGQAITPWCHINNPYTENHQMMIDNADEALRLAIHEMEEGGKDMSWMSR